MISTNLIKISIYNITNARWGRSWRHWILSSWFFMLLYVTEDKQCFHQLTFFLLSQLFWRWKPIDLIWALEVHIEHRDGVKSNSAPGVSDRFGYTYQFWCSGIHGLTPWSKSDGVDHIYFDFWDRWLLLSYVSSGPGPRGQDFVKSQAISSSLFCFDKFTKTLLFLSHILEGYQRIDIGGRRFCSLIRFADEQLTTSCSRKRSPSPEMVSLSIWRGWITSKISFPSCFDNFFKCLSIHFCICIDFG